MKPLLSEEERETMRIEREKIMEEQYRKGKIIVSTIAVLYIIFTVIASIINLNILSLIINISAACALFFGIKWVRVYYAISVGIGILSFIVLIFNPNVMSLVPIWAIILNLFQLVYGIVSSVLLFKSKAVVEFMEIQRELPY